ncbi:unnamed protein product [Paramecium octaurelia]|uniref:Uncharacterized protein n=1 Tax=Paramecium octaurelia TaxID=43137 RepID=A0A8S1WXQ1_PAROT|nr:unnamed protein product [Paramecium octaurelia]
MITGNSNIRIIIKSIFSQTILLRIIIAKQKVFINDNKTVCVNELFCDPIKTKRNNNFLVIFKPSQRILQLFFNFVFYSLNEKVEVIKAKILINNEYASISQKQFLQLFSFSEKRQSKALKIRSQLFAWMMNTNPLKDIVQLILKLNQSTLCLKKTNNYDRQNLLFYSMKRTILLFALQKKNLKQILEATNRVVIIRIYVISPDKLVIKSALRSQQRNFSNEKISTSPITI